MKELEKTIVSACSVLITFLVIFIFFIFPLAGAGTMFIKFCIYVFNKQYFESLVPLSLAGLLLIYDANIINYFSKKR